jgi:hypothetical protein
MYSYKLLCVALAFMIKQTENVKTRLKAKKSANRGAVAYSPLFRSPAREWFVL